MSDSPGDTSHLIQDCPIRRFEDGKPAAMIDKVITEARIQLDINDGQHSLAMLCLPHDLESLAVGFLIGEGALRDRADLRDVRVNIENNKVFIHGDLDEDSLEAMANRWTWGTGCGSGGTGRDLDAPAFGRVGEGLNVGANKLIELAKNFTAKADMWKSTGGLHACGLADNEKIILFAEDVGRHNAFDKIMGRAFLDEIDLSDKMVLMTGRLSAEIVSKAVACGLTMLVSRSAVTALGAKLAGRFGLTLVGFLRGKRLNVYTGFDRVTAD
ncbi:MAG: formate dehydrogenase accessory sulfurtransferase FdhD [Phycisphaerales bacterium]|jgi:FdhD protein|nr:formate dehydrogenase accessory sulfurtransferase FdhD [Phycisphaerales bacterium]